MKIFRKIVLTAAIAALSIAMLVACNGGGGGNGGVGGDEDKTGGYGNLCIEDVTVYINGNGNKTFAEITPVFTVPEKAEELAYTYDATQIKIENNIVTPLKRNDQTVNVRAKSEHFNVVFKVEVEYIRFTGAEASTLYDVSRFSGGISNGANKCKTATSDTTLFIGDSFTDDHFIGEYMSGYSSDKHAMNAGISSTTSYHWEACYSSVIGTATPKNIAMHVGTNNFYDAHDSVEDTVNSLKRLFMFMHDSYPTTNIYWFDITQRADTSFASQVTETNRELANWCAKYDWITCVDTCSKITVGMLRDDGVHPKTESYKVFTDALSEAGCVIVNK